MCVEELLQPNAVRGAKCLTTADCLAANDACAGEGCGRTCQQAGGLQQPCLVDWVCNEGLWCDVEVFRCLAPKAVGASCIPNRDHLGECHPAVSYCDPTSRRCIDLPAAGQLCRSGRCNPTAWCNNTGVCIAVTPLDKVCEDPRECGRDAYCHAETSPATCQPRRVIRSNCQSRVQCVSPLVCFQGNCVPPLPSRAPCVSNAQCGSDRCDTVLHLCGDSNMYLGAGEACSDDVFRCAQPFPCLGVVALDGGGGTPGKCAPTTLGSPCYNQDFCVGGTYCDQRPDAGICVASSGANPCTCSGNCEEGRSCPEGTCVPKGNLGETCYAGDYSSCKPGTRCMRVLDGGLGECRIPGTEGAPCQSAYECYLFHVCTADQCRAGGHSGEACLNGNACLTGACETDAGTCGPTREAGESCLLGFDCASGLCLDGKCVTCGP